MNADNNLLIPRSITLVRSPLHPPRGRTQGRGVGGGRRLGEEPGEVRGITSLMFWLG